MADAKELQRVWVELREQSDGRRVVLKCFSSADISPSRAPRRQLDLAASGSAQLLEGDATDRLRPTRAGDWRVEGSQLELNIKDWEGRYEIEELSDDTLILQRH